MTCTAVIPVWNRRDLLERCLASIAAQTRRFDPVIVVDNGSTDGAADVARRAGAQVLEMGRNAGFAAAMNQGIGAARTEWIAALNDDVELAPDWLDRILAGVGDAWFASGKLLQASAPDRIDGTYDLLA